MFPLLGQNNSNVLSNLLSGTALGGGQSTSALGGVLGGGNLGGGNIISGLQQLGQGVNAGAAPLQTIGNTLNQASGGQANAQWQALIGMLLQKLGLGSMGGGNQALGGALGSLGPYGSVGALGALAPFAALSGIYGK